MYTHQYRPTHMYMYMYMYMYIPQPALHIPQKLVVIPVQATPHSHYGSVEGACVSSLGVSAL